MRSILLIFTCFFLGTGLAFAQDGSHDHNHDHSDGHHDHSHDTDGHHDGGDHMVCGISVSHDYDAAATALHHISDANVYSIGPLHLPLPCILYTDGKWTTFMSSKFGTPDSHGTALKAVDGYVMYEGTVMNVKDKSFPMGEQPIAGVVFKDVEVANGDKVEKKSKAFVCSNDQLYALQAKQTADFGLFGGDTESTFTDFSITKNVTSMFIVMLILFFMLRAAAKGYQKRKGQAPKGIQSLFETVILFIRDEVAYPFIGKKKAGKFLPFLLSVFFFILGLNLFGQVPFFGGSNVTGNLAATMVLAIIVFIITTISGNKHYWEHILWMPGVPWPVKLILTPVEILGMFIKPITLMLRLAANITAGHMVLVIFIGFIFIMKGQFGAIGGYVSIPVSIALSLFMMAIELIVAFVQAFVFTLLAASYFGAAVEEAHH